MTERERLEIIRQVLATVLESIDRDKLTFEQHREALRELLRVTDAALDVMGAAVQ